MEEEKEVFILEPDMAMVKVIIRSRGLIFPVFPLSRARKMLRRTMSASHLNTQLTIVIHMGSHLLREDFPHNLNDLRFGDLTLREPYFETVPQFHDLAICQLLTLNKNQQVFQHVLWN